MSVEMEPRNEIQIKYKGGGSIINFPPIFSPDNQHLYITWLNLLRCYNVGTGEKVIDLDDSDDNIIVVQINPINSKLMVACSISGEIVTWKWQAKLLISKKKIKSNIDQVHSFHLIPNRDKTDYEILLTWTDSKKYKIGLFTSKDLKLRTDLTKHFGNKSIAIHTGTGFIAAINRKKLTCFKFDSESVMKQEAESGKTFTCLACHPEEDCIAVADSSGCITLFRDLFAPVPGPVRTIYHWHTLAVNVLLFSASGTVLYSGGNECVLVKWNLDGLYKDFLPRLPAPIVNLAMAFDSVLLAISTKDNSIHLIDTHFHVKCVIQNLTWPSVLNAGLHLDPRTKSLVLNGHVGNVQFYQPNTMSLLYNLEIVDENKLTEERKLKIPNTEVHKIALSKMGDWLACIEQRSDRNSCSEIRLKFFYYDHVKQNFTLNTSIEFPHENGVNCIEFQPIVNSTDFCCATSGMDQQFKIWQLVDTSDIYSKKRSWRCNSTNYYKNWDSNSLSFSTDGSLLAVAFGPCLTAWSPDTCEMKCSLVHPSFKQPLQLVKFGNVDECHLVVVVSDERLCVWNLLTLGLIWTVSLKVEHLCADPFSIYMAVFTTNNELFVFSPGSSKPVYHNPKLCENNVTITGATFLPHNTERNTRISWQKNSHLYFMNSKQELLSLESETDLELKSNQNGLEFTSQPQRSLLTTLMAKTVTSTRREQETGKRNQWDTGLPGSTGIKQLLEPPIHTMAPMRLLCSSVLRSLICNAHNNYVNINQLPESNQNDLNDENDSNFDPDSDSDLDLKSRDKSEPRLTQLVESNIVDEENLESVLNEQLNWTAILLD